MNSLYGGRCAVVENIIIVRAKWHANSYRIAPFFLYVSISSIRKTYGLAARLIKNVFLVGSAAFANKRIAITLLLLAAARLLRADLAVTHYNLAVLKRDERHAAVDVEQVVMSNQRMLTQSVLSLAVVPEPWPSS
jgi:hypothetical protein